MQTGFIGLGAMGFSMARNLHGAGLLAGVFNRNPVRAAEFCQSAGAPAYRSLEALAENCEVLVLCVSADADVLSVVEAIAGTHPAGKLVIDCSTVSRDTAVAAAARLLAEDCDFLDAPVSGGTEGARLGQLSIMVGGAAAVFERALPVMNAMGQRILHMGPVGAGQATKAVNQVMAAGINQAVTEAMAFAHSLDLPVEKLIDVVGSGAAGNWFVTHRGASMLAGAYPPGFKLALHLKDLLICRQMAQAAGGHLPLSEATIADYQRLIETGHADEDISALYRLKADLFPNRVDTS